MPRSIYAIACVVLLTAISLAEDAKVVVSEIDLKDVPAAIERGKPTEPTVITSREALAKAFADEKVAARIGKEVEFEKQKLIYFAWAGSGQDKLTHTVEKGEKGDIVKFKYMPGRTRDLRGHHRLFAIPKDTMFEVAGR